MIEQIIKKIKLCLPKKYKQLNVHEPIFKEKDITYLKNCIDSSYVSTEGKYIDKFTENLKKITNSRNILLTSSGTSALFLSLKTIDVDTCEVLIPSMTFVATPNSVMHANGIPHFIDSSKNSLNINAFELEEYLKKITVIRKNKCINNSTGRVIKAIIVVHAYGEPADIIKISRVAKKYNIEVLEDGAGALGTYQNSKHIGLHSRFAIISFNGNKIITTGMGGAILFKQKKDYDSVKHLISTARLKHNWKVEHNMVGYNLRMANINAALGYGQLKRIQKTLREKKILYNKYKNIFKNNKYCFLHKYDEKNKPNHWVTNLYLKNEYKKFHQQLIQSLHNENIIVRELWKPQHMNNMYKCMPKSTMANAINHWKTGISLPSSYYK